MVEIAVVVVAAILVTVVIALVVVVAVVIVVVAAEIVVVAVVAIVVMVAAAVVIAAQYSTKGRPVSCNVFGFNGSAGQAAINSSIYIAPPITYVTLSSNPGN